MINLFKKSMDKLVKSDELLQKILSRDKHPSGNFPIKRKILRPAFLDFGSWCCGKPPILIKEYEIEISPKGIKKEIPVNGFIYYCAKCGDIMNYVDYAPYSEDGSRFNYKVREA